MTLTERLKSRRIEFLGEKPLQPITTSKALVDSMAELAARTRADDGAKAVLWSSLSLWLSGSRVTPDAEAADDYPPKSMWNGER